MLMSILVPPGLYLVVCEDLKMFIRISWLRTGDHKAHVKFSSMN